MRIDLHNHSIHSDGVLNCSELVDLAIKNNVDIFALTDHDSVFGCDEIERIALEKNVKIIKGMELSTEYNGESIHIVCLFKNNIVPKKMLDFSYDVVKRRKARAIKMMENVKNIYGLKIDLDDLFKDNEIITRANMLRNIAKCNNLSLADASFYVSSKSNAYIPSTKMTVLEGLNFAKSCDCVTILAHPCLYKYENVLEILKYGFDGIEARYANIKNDEKKFARLAKEYNLFISAGSDCHGDETHATIGSATLNEMEFAPIAKLLNWRC